MTFLHGEHLDPSNGTITHAVQALTQGAYEQTTYIFGNNTAMPAVFEPLFVSYGFRYMQLSGKALVAPTVNDITCWKVHTELERVGSFAFAPAANAEMQRRQDLLTANYNATILTAEANWISFPTDCPHRERRGWLGDAQAAAETLASHFDMAAGNTKWLEDIRNAADLMYNNGNFPTLAPNYGSPNAPGARPSAGFTSIAWSSAFVLVWDWTWRRYNDLSLARRHYARAREYLDFLQLHADPRTHVLPVGWQGGAPGSGLLGDWCAALGVNGTGSGGAGGQFTSRHASGTFNTFYFIRTHEAWLRAHDALGMPASEATPYRTWVNQARSGFNYAYFNRSLGTYGDPAVAADVSLYGEEPLQTTLALALTMGVADLPHVNATAQVAHALLHDVQVTQAHRLTTGLIGSKYLFPALAEHGGMDTALTVLTQAADPSYQYMLDQGPGTLWEEWLGNASWVRPRGSLNHIMLGSHLAWFYSHLGGLQLPDDSVGWSTVRVAPSMTKLLRGFGVELITVRGPLRCSWEWHGTAGGYAMNVTVPVGSMANVTFTGVVSITENATTVFADGRFVARASSGVVAGGRAGAKNALWLTVLSGDYWFAAQ